MVSGEPYSYLKLFRSSSYRREHSTTCYRCLVSGAVSIEKGLNTQDVSLVYTNLADTFFLFFSWIKHAHTLTPLRLAHLFITSTSKFSNKLYKIYLWKCAGAVVAVAVSWGIRYISWGK